MWERKESKNVSTTGNRDERSRDRSRSSRNMSDVFVSLTVTKSDLELLFRPRLTGISMSDASGRFQKRSEPNGGQTNLFVRAVGAKTGVNRQQWAKAQYRGLSLSCSHQKPQWWQLLSANDSLCSLCRKTSGRNPNNQEKRNYDRVADEISLKKNDPNWFRPVLQVATKTLCIWSSNVHLNLLFVFVQCSNCFSQSQLSESACRPEAWGFLRTTVSPMTEFNLRSGRSHVQNQQVMWKKKDAVH